MYAKEEQEFLDFQIKHLEELRQLALKDKEKAKQIAISELIDAGILGEDGNFISPYNGEVVNDNDFSMGPKLIKNKNP